MIKNHFIYLLQEREFINSKKNIFKIGRTCQDATGRFNQYPKNSILLFHIICYNSIHYEKILKDKFKILFTLRDDIGNEYFEGDYKHMIHIIYDTINDISIGKIITEKINDIAPFIQNDTIIDKTTHTDNFFIIYEKNNQSSNFYNYDDMKDDGSDNSHSSNDDTVSNYCFKYVNYNKLCKFINNDTYTIFYFKYFDYYSINKELAFYIISNLAQILSYKIFKGKLNTIIKVFNKILFYEKYKQLYFQDVLDRNSKYNSRYPYTPYDYNQIIYPKHQEKSFNLYALKFIQNEFNEYKQDFSFNGNKKFIKIIYNKDEEQYYVKYINWQIKKLIFYIDDNNVDNIRDDIFYDIPPVHYEPLVLTCIYNDSYVNYLHNLIHKKIIVLDKIYNLFNDDFKNKINDSKFNINIQHFNIFLEFYNFNNIFNRYNNKDISNFETYDLFDTHIQHFLSCDSVLNNTIYFSTGEIVKKSRILHSQFTNFNNIYIDKFSFINQNNKYFNISNDKWIKIYFINDKWYDEKSFLKRFIPRVLLFNDKQQYKFLCKNQTNNEPHIFNQNINLFYKHTKPWRSILHFNNFKKIINDTIYNFKLSSCLNTDHSYFLF